MPILFHPDDEVLVRIHAQLASCTPGGTAPLTLGQLTLLVDRAFWASLEVNEGRSTRVCLALMTPDLVPGSAPFAEPVPCDAQQIAKLAPAAPLDGCLLVVPRDSGVCLWGLGHCRPTPQCGALVLDVWEPGVVRVGIGPYPTFAVLNGRTNAVIEGRNTNLPRYLQRVLGKTGQGLPHLESQAVWRECRAIADLARVIVAGGHGGIVLVVPEETGDWERSLNPFAYRFARPDTGIREAIRCKLRQERDRADVMQKLFTEESADSFEGSLLGTLAPLPVEVGVSVRAVAALAGADGAIVMTRAMDVLGFGAKIAVQGNTLPRAALFRPELGAQNVVPAPFEDIGGTRHQSSARFVDAHHDTVALVISQDRHMSVIHWDAQVEGLCVLRNAEWWV